MGPDNPGNAGLPPRRGDRMAGALLGTARVLAAGYVLFFFSELLFWTVLRPGQNPGELLVTWLAYCAPAYAFLVLVHRVPVPNWAAVFMAGTVYGWLVEGCLAPTLYGTEPSAPFPVSILSTAASWHALISAVVGWHFMQGWLRRPGPVRRLGLPAAVGVFWGLWAPFQWLETPAVVTPLPRFLAGGLAMTAPLVPAYWLLGKAEAGRFVPGRFGLAGSGLVLAVFYAQHVAALGIRPLLVLPALLTLAVGVLEISRRRAPDAVPADGPGEPVSLGRCLAVLAAPLAAAAAYGLALALRPRWPALHVPIYWGLAAAGGVCLAGSAATLLRTALRRPGRFGSPRQAPPAGRRALRRLPGRR